VNKLELRVWHIPQVPGKPFIVPVADLKEGQRLVDILADYDCFQFDNNIKPDYCNASGIDYLCPVDDEWCSVEDEEEYDLICSEYASRPIEKDKGE